MKGVLLEEVDSYRYLGTVVDKDLSGEPQFSQLTKTLGFKLRTFGKIRRYLTSKAALMVYKSTILPIIDYNDYFQLLWNANNIQKLQKYQNWGLRIVFSDRQPELSEDEMHSEAKLSKIKDRRVSHLLDLMYHRSKNNSRLDERDMPTRQFAKIKFKVIAPLVKKAFKCPNFYGSQLWDQSPIETQSAPTPVIFKKKVKQHFMEGLFVNT